jgi:ABC-type phosphate transport system substrate-binding protein
MNILFHEYLLLWLPFSNWTNRDATIPTRDVSGYRYQCKIGNKTRRVLRVEVALDGVVVVLQPNGVAAQCVQSMGGYLAANQLRWIFSSKTVETDDVRMWSDMWSDCAAEVIQLVGPDESSAAYQFFTETIFLQHEVGETFYQAAPNAYVAYADKEQLWTFLESNGAAIGFMSYADVYNSTRSSLYVVPIKNDNGDLVVPTMETMSTATYLPLSRRLYLDVWDNPTSLTNTAPFLKFGLSPEGTSVLSDDGYIATSAAAREVMMERLGGTINYTGYPTSRAATDKADYDLVIGVSLAVGGGLLAAALVVLVVFFGLRPPNSGSSEESAPSTSATTSRNDQEKSHTPPKPLSDWNVNT